MQRQVTRGKRKFGCRAGRRRRGALVDPRENGRGEGPALGPRLDTTVAGGHGGLAGVGGAVAGEVCRVRLERVLERALDERDRHQLDNFINDGLGLGAFRIDDEVAALNKLGEDPDVHRGGAGGEIGPEVVAALLRELPKQRTVVRDGAGRRRRTLGAGVEGPALVPRVRGAALGVASMAWMSPM